MTITSEIRRNRPETHHEADSLVKEKNEMPKPPGVVVGASQRKIIEIGMAK